METWGELNHRKVVESSLREIAKQLRIRNRLEEFRLRKDYPFEDDAKIIDAIMEGRE